MSPQSSKTYLDELRERISKLRKLRDEAIMEMGLAAEENKDLRENSVYDYWNLKQLGYTFQITGLVNEIEQIKLSNRKNNIKIKKPNSPKKQPFEKHKWL